MSHDLVFEIFIMLDPLIYTYYNLHENYKLANIILLKWLNRP